MEKAFLWGAGANLAINVCYTLLALLVSVWAFKWIDAKVFTKIDFEEEIKKGNIAAAIFAATLLIFIALIVSFGLKG